MQLAAVGERVAVQRPGLRGPGVQVAAVGERVAEQRPGLSMSVARRGKAWCTGKGGTPQAARGRITVVCTERKVHR